MVKFHLTITCDNEAFEPCPLYEVGGILQSLGVRLMYREEIEAGILRDVYGNKVGEYRFEEAAL